MQQLLFLCWGHTMVFVKTESQGLSICTILVIIARAVQDRALWYLQQSLTSQHGWPSENPARNKRVFVVDKSHLSDNSPILEEQSIWYAINYIKKYARMPISYSSSFKFLICNSFPKRLKVCIWKMWSAYKGISVFSVSDLPASSNCEWPQCDGKAGWGVPASRRGFQPPGAGHCRQGCTEPLPPSPWAHWRQL